MIQNDRELRSYYRILIVLKKHVSGKHLVEIKREIRSYYKKEGEIA